MSHPRLNPASPRLEGPGVSWLVALSLAVLLPVLEWGMPRAVRLLGLQLTTTSFWAADLIMNGLFAVLLFLIAGRSLTRVWEAPGLKALGLTLIAFVVGWMVIPMVQMMAAPLAASAPAASASTVSLIPETGLQYILLGLASLFGATAQEGVFRGLVWQRVSASTRSDWVALLVSSLLFSLLFVTGSVVNFLSVGLAWGLVAGALYLITKRLSAVILLNTLNVFMTYAVLLRYLP